MCGPRLGDGSALDADGHVVCHPHGPRSGAESCSRGPLGGPDPCACRGIVAVLDQACQALVMLVGLEAMVLPHAPVLVAVETHRRARGGGARGPDRTPEPRCA